VTSLTWDLGDTQTGRAGEGQGEPERDRESWRGPGGVGEGGGRLGTWETLRDRERRRGRLQRES
jgi:hypothetical protein